MEDSKTLLFYLLSIAGLIVVSVLSTGQIEPVEIEPPQRPPVNSTVMEVKSLVKQWKTEQPCSSTNQIAFYSPDLSHLEDDQLVISGTVYASDFVTPLPDAPVEVSLIAPNSYEAPRNAFDQRFYTDEAGRYEVAIPKPEQYGLIYLHYRANDQAECALTIQLFFLANPTAGHSARVSDRVMKLGLAQKDPPGLVLQGPIDVVLSILPQLP